MRLARDAGIDRASGFAILARFWQLLTGPITQILITLCMSAAGQDYYYAFNSLLGMQVFLELGLHAVLINLASREWARLELVEGKISGHPESLKRLATLGRLTVSWYRGVSVLFVVSLISMGLLYFSRIEEKRLASEAASSSLVWISPWICLVMINGALLSILPVTSILEGCHQVVAIHRVRLWQWIAGSLAVWVSLMAGLGLWALVASSAIRLCGEFYLARLRFPQFYELFRTQGYEQSFVWKHEILPLQWRMALQGVAVWGANQMPVLVLLNYFPASGEAGRLGMTWTILSAFQSVGMAMIETRRPLFGSLVERKEFKSLDETFFRLTLRSMVAIVLLVSAYCLLIALIQTRSEWLAVKFSERLLPLLPTILLSVAFICYQFVMCLGIYVRSHRVDPFVVASVLSCAVIAVLEFTLGRKFQATGVAFGYLAGVVVTLLPCYVLIWRNFRQRTPADEVCRAEQSPQPR